MHWDTWTIPPWQPCRPWFGRSRQRLPRFLVAIDAKTKKLVLAEDDRKASSRSHVDGGRGSLCVVPEIYELRQCVGHRSVRVGRQAIGRLKAAARPRRAR